MNSEAITTLGWVGASPTFRNPTEQQYPYLDGPNSSLEGASLSEVSLVVGGSDPSMSVHRMYSAMMHGMQNGFMGSSMTDVLELLVEAGKPNGDIGLIDLQAAVMTAASNMTIANLASTITNKTTEALQTLVVKQA